MKKKRVLAAAMTALLMGTLVLSGCKKSEDKLKIGIVMMIENGAFSDMEQGIEEQLEESGYDDSKAEIVVKNAQGDATTLQTIAQEMADGSYDLVFTIATPATQAMVNMESDTPTFFCAVSAPVAAGILSDMEHPDKNATGTSNAIPINKIFELSETLTPDVESFGFLYCTSEDNSVNTVKNAIAYCEENDIPYEEATVTNSSEVQQAVEALAEKVDAIFIPNDSVIQSAISTVTEITREKGIPTYASSATTVQSGAFATIAISDVEIGKKTAEMAISYLEGTPLEEIPSVVVEASYTAINKDTMEALGLELSQDITNNVVFLEDAE